MTSVLTLTLILIIVPPNNKKKIKHAKNERGKKVRKKKSLRVLLEIW